MAAKPAQYHGAAKTDFPFLKALPLFLLKRLSPTMVLYILLAKSLRKVQQVANINISDSLRSLPTFMFTEGLLGLQLKFLSYPQDSYKWVYDLVNYSLSFCLQVAYHTEKSYKQVK